MPRSPSSRLSDDLFIDLYINNQISVKEIASKYGYTIGGIYQRIKRLGFSAQVYKNKHNSLEGKRFGGLLVKEMLQERDYKKRIQYLCECDCGKDIILSSRRLIEGTKYCNNYLCQRKYKKWMGYEEIHKTYWNIIQKSAIDRNLDFSITMKYAWNIFLLQDRKCALTGIDISFAIRYHDFNSTASLDRIDSSKGYIEGNVQWIHKALQDMKWDKNELEFIKWCGLIWEYSKGRLNENTTHQ